MFGSFCIDVCKFLIFSMTHTSLFYRSEYFDFINHLIERFSIVLFENHFDAHCGFSAVKNNCLSRAGANLFNFDLVFEKSYLMVISFHLLFINVFYKSYNK